ncbi:MAG: hypothetical protein KJ052_16825 [Candidatus Hydrogenedentes bacterium]|nr:hypothetical protein [Candidatus Hydrogenedentota bacterium]
MDLKPSVIVDQIADVLAGFSNLPIIGTFINILVGVVRQVADILEGFGLK